MEVEYKIITDESAGVFELNEMLLMQMSSEGWRVLSASWSASGLQLRAVLLERMKKHEYSTTFPFVA